MPAWAIFHGSSVDDAPSEGNARDARIDNAPASRISQPTDAALGQHLIEYMTANEFDVTRTNKLPEGRRGAALSVTRSTTSTGRLMDNKATPNVPVMVNTYYPPNAPTAPRCYKFGKALRQAIETWDSDKRVAILASGGLSHTVIEEDLDMRIIEGLQNDDVAKLTDYPDARFRAGTSEIKNWIRTGRGDVRHEPDAEHSRLRPLLSHRSRQRLRDGPRGVGLVALSRLTGGRDPQWSRRPSVGLDRGVSARSPRG